MPKRKKKGYILFFFEKVAGALPFIKKERKLQTRLHILNRTGPATKGPETGEGAKSRGFRWVGSSPEPP
jgi:hypothetical protein